MMLRHIISVSLAMTACATLIPTKANAVSLTLQPVGSLQRNPGESIEFILSLNPEDFGTNGEVTIVDIFTPLFDGNELSYDPLRTTKVIPGTLVTNTTTIARFIFNVLPGVVKDGNSDVLGVTVDLGSEQLGISIIDDRFDVEPVPEPLTIFGTATAFGCGVLFKRKFSKKTVA